MNNNYYDSPIIESSVETKTSVAFAKSYLYMFIACALTLLSGLFFTKVLANVLVTGNGATTILILFIISFVAQLILCYKINKNSLINANFAKAFIGLMLYGLMTGFTFSTLFIFFQVDILYQVFGVVSGYFLILSLITFIFRKVIHKARTFAYIGLLTLLLSSIGVSIYSMFALRGTTVMGLFLAISIIGIVVFTIITMVDIKHTYHLIEYSENKNAASVAAAFTLYLDFLNIFIYILRILIILGKNVSRD